jgi:hypothetical protein
MLDPTESRQYRFRQWVVLTMRVHNEGAVPWTPARAQLTPATAPPIPVRVVFPSRAAIAPGADAPVAVELELPASGGPHAADATYELTLCDSAEERCLSTSGWALALQ